MFFICSHKNFKLVKNHFLPVLIVLIHVVCDIGYKCSEEMLASVEQQTRTQDNMSQH